MATNAAAVKRALADRLVARFAATAAVSGVRVTYAPPGRIEREHLYLGKAVFAQEATDGRGAARQEVLTVTAHVYVRIPGGEQADADARAVEIGAVLEGMLSSDPTMVGVPGVMFASVTSGELDGGDDDDAVVAVVSYELAFYSTLR